MQQHLTRLEAVLAVAALGFASAGVLLLLGGPAPVAPARPEASQVATAPSPPAALPPSPSAPPAETLAVSTPSPAPPPAPLIAASGPAQAQPWRTAVYLVTFQLEGEHTLSVWWTGAAMARWSWTRVDGHSLLQAAGQDKLTWRVFGPGTVELDLTPSGAPGGHLVIAARDGAGPVLQLAGVEVPEWAG